MAPSWQWIAVVLLNTMNGPGFVTLPQAGRDAGPGVVVAVIGGFGLLAAFTSRRAIAVVAELEARRGAGGVGDFASMSRDVLGARAAAAAAAACVAALLACGLAQIILCVQLADALELRATGVRCARWRAGRAAAGPASTSAAAAPTSRGRARPSS
ncbi:hypothetical protein JL720_5036 [Aureococcus anophagefferens]|nr:hypothetical protein JL720_5036 [Aureococcus anophagefferens]